MKILNNKRGVVLENAIIFMLVIFSLCFLLTSLTLISYHQTKIDLIELENKLQIDQIGEDGIKYLDGKTIDDIKSEDFERTIEKPLNYTCKFEYNEDEHAEYNGHYTLSISHKNSPDDVELEIKVSINIDDNGIVKVNQIQCWRYPVNS